jgi:Domain of unknown function (DUF4136)
MPELLPLQSSERVVEVPLWTPELLSGATQSGRRDERRKIPMKKMLLLSIALFLLLVSAAVGQDVRYNFDKDTDFAKFKTYKWVALKDAPEVDNLRDKQIKEAVDAELTTKGLTKTDADSADLYIGYQAAIGTEKQFTSYNTDWGYGPGWYRGGWYGGGSSMTTGQTSTIYTGQLAVDFYDSKNHDLVWRGVASKTIDTKAKPEKQQKNLTKAVTKLLKNYPPPPPKSK